LEQLSSRLGIRDQVEFTGEIPPGELERWFARAEVVLFPVLRPEPFGLIGVEALAHAKSVVAFDGGAVEEWLWPDQTGLLVAQRTPAAFAARIRELLENPARIAAMADNARARYPQFHPAAYIERLVGAYRRAQDWFRRGA
jgi:D-inositol-3-phosphate glycosyltransferase